jgi:hypothetical protein
LASTQGQQGSGTVEKAACSPVALIWWLISSRMAAIREG